VIYGKGMTMRLPPDPAGIAEAARLIRAGGLVALPTETVYGLGADATNPAAVARIYAAKGRPAFNPLIAHLATLEAAQAEGTLDAAALRLARQFWPGPLTLVVPRIEGGKVCDLACAGLASVGLRIPSHPVALDLLKAAGRPVAAPSANRSGHVSPTLPEHVLADLDGVIDAVVMAGPCPVGVESTIVGCLGNEAVLLRPGGITRADLSSSLGEPVRDPVQTDDNQTPQSPGRLTAHYAPETPLRLNATSVSPGEALLAFGPALPSGADKAHIVQNLSRSANLTEAATHLYTFLRNLDKLRASAIAVAPIPESGLGEAINDRLRRAAAAKSVCN